MKVKVKSHPERLAEEVLLFNYSSDAGGQELFGRIGWKSKRKGNIAYGQDGNIVPNFFPVFVQRSEMEESGIEFED